MTDTLKRLFNERDTVTEQLLKIRRDIGLARKQAADEEISAALLDRTADDRQAKKARDLESTEAGLERRIAVIGKAIDVQATREEEEVKIRRYQEIQKLLKTQKPTLERIRGFCFDLRTEVEKFMTVVQASGLQLDGHAMADLLFPVADPQHPGADFAVRASQLGMVNSAFAWIGDDCLHPGRPRLKRGNGSGGHVART